MMKEQIFVVEGKNDVAKIKQVFPSLNVISVNGSEINEDVLKWLKTKVDTYEIVLCLDPDYAGEKIRKELTNELKIVSHIFINRQKAKSKNNKKLGWEHLSSEDLIKAFEKKINPNLLETSDVTKEFLYQEKLIGFPNSKIKRKILLEKMNLGYVNGKTLLKRINSFGIKKAEIVKHLDQ